MDRIDIIESMILQDDQNASAWYLLGREYKDQNMRTKALESYAKAMLHGDASLKDKIFEELEEMKDDFDCKEETEEEIVEDSIEDMPSTWQNQQEVAQVIPFDAENRIPLKVIEGGAYKTPLTMEETGLQTVSFCDVGGLDSLKDIINMKIVKPFVNPGLFERFRKKVGGGVLLYGPPGCGKTFMARATAGECKARFLPVHITDILDPYVGVSEQNVQAIFANARAKKPSILFFDELDTIGYNRSKLSSEHMRSVTDQLLTELEGIDSNTDRLLVLGATNMPWDIDSAFKRPGRFDKMVFVAPPDESARAIIFQLKLKGKPVEELDYVHLAKYTELYSGADIDNVIEVATENVISDILTSGVERSINMNDLLDAISSTRPSTLEWLRTIKNYVKYSNQSGLYDDVEKYLNKHKKLLGSI